MRHDHLAVPLSDGTTTDQNQIKAPHKIASPINCLHERYRTVSTCDQRQTFLNLRHTTFEGTTQTPH